ncbi:MAG: acetyl-CoA carboxylase biotin carboxyl carrier protein, partial [candidate division WOR-3 bacterium]
DPGIRRLGALMELSSLHSVTELEWEVGEEKIRIKRQPLETLVSQETPAPTPPQKPSETSPATSQKEAAIPTEPVGSATQMDITTESTRPVTAVKTEPITSPMVGTFYSRARPEAPAFVEKGDVVEPGQTLCIVEAMKLMNEIQAEKKCRIIDILVKDGDSVEYGQPLMLVEPL